MRPRIAIALTALLVLLIGWRACCGPEERIAFLLYDDAYYYLGVARHLAAGQGSTFDGLHATNGYHPLWCWLLVPVVALFRDPGNAVRAAGWLWFALAAAVPLIAFWALRRRLGEVAAGWAAVVFTLQPWIALALARPNGLETPLYVLAILAVAGSADRVLGVEAPPPWGRVFGVGALVGACLLARLDAGALAVALAISVAVAGARRWGPRAALACVAVLAGAAAVVAGPSLAWNVARFGSALPVSGRVVALEAVRERAELGGVASLAHIARRSRYTVADIPASIVRRAALGVPGERLLAGTAAGIAAVVAAAAAALLAWRRRRVRVAPPGDPVVVLGTFAALHFAAYAAWLWTPGEDVYRVYYFVPELLALSLVAGWWLARARPGLGAVVAAVLALHLVVESERYLKLLDAHGGRVADRFVYGWIRAKLPEGAVIAARDAGKLGWFSGRTVVGLDGLINDDRFVETLAGGRVGAYVCDSPIGHVFIDRAYLAEFLADLERTAVCTFRDIDPGSKDWAVLEVLR